MLNDEDHGAWLLTDELLRALGLAVAGVVGLLGGWLYWRRRR